MFDDQYFEPESEPDNLEIARNCLEQAFEYLERYEKEVLKKESEIERQRALIERGSKIVKSFTSPSVEVICGFRHGKTAYSKMIIEASEWLKDASGEAKDANV